MCLRIKTDHMTREQFSFAYQEGEHTGLRTGVIEARSKATLREALKKVEKRREMELSNF